MLKLIHIFSAMPSKAHVFKQDHIWTYTAAVTVRIDNRGRCDICNPLWKPHHTNFTCTTAHCMLVIVFLILSGPMKPSTVLCNEALYRQLSELTTRMRVCRDHGRDDDYILI